MKKKLTAVAVVALISVVHPTFSWSQTHRDATIAFEQRNYKKAAQVWTALAEKGDVTSQAILGGFYLMNLGKELKPDHKKALYWLEKCEHQTVVCKFDLGRIYEEGWGVPKDPERAANLYRSFATSGYDYPEKITQARLRLGHLYFAGPLARENRPHANAQAKEWFALAAKGGNHEAQQLLAFLLARSDIPEDLIEALKWCTIIEYGEDYVSQRICEPTLNSVKKRLTQSEMAEARRRALLWRPSKG